MTGKTLLKKFLDRTVTAAVYILKYSPMRAVPTRLYIMALKKATGKLSQNLWIHYLFTYFSLAERKF